MMTSFKGETAKYVVPAPNVLTVSASRTSAEVGCWTSEGDGSKEAFNRAAPHLLQKRWPVSAYAPHFVHATAGVLIWYAIVLALTFVANERIEGFEQWTGAHALRPSCEKG
jgi:hypothetical protein